MFGDENVFSTATGRRYNNTTSAKHESHTFKLAMNKCRGSEGNIVVGRESSNIIDDDSAHNKILNTHGDDVLTVKKAGDREDTEGNDPLLDDVDNPLAFNAKQARTITTTQKTS